MSTPLNDFYRGTAQAESAGGRRLVNPNSSARGLYQFTEDTWGGIVRNYGSRYGIRADGVMDHDQQDLAIRAITENEYLPAVRSAGRAATPAELYMPHLLGVPTYRSLVSADPNAPASKVIRNWVNDRGRGVFQANRGVFRDPNITVGEAIQRIQAYYNGKAGTGGPRKAPEAHKVPPPVASSPAPTVPVSSDPPTSWMTLVQRITSLISRVFNFRKV